MIGDTSPKAPRDYSDVDFIDDRTITAAQRAHFVAYTTVRIGHNRRRCWPIDELPDVAAREQL